jgi:hypothetical protein
LSNPEPLQHSLVTPPEKVLKIERKRAHLTHIFRGPVDLGRNVSCHKLISNPFSAALVRRILRMPYCTAQQARFRRVQLTSADKAFRSGLLRPCLSSPGAIAAVRIGVGPARGGRANGPIDGIPSLKGTYNKRFAGGAHRTAAK